MLNITSLEYSYSISYDDINSVEILKDSDINILFKTNGIGNERYSRGNYDVASLGNCFVCTYNSSNLLIVIKTDDKNIIYSEKTSNKTKEMYDNLLKKVLSKS